MQTKHLRVGGVQIVVSEGKPETAQTRRVEQLFQLEDPNGVPIEVFCGTGTEMRIGRNGGGHPRSPEATFA